MNFLNKFKLENLKNTFKSIWQRTPVAIILIFTVSILFLVQIYQTEFSITTENILNKIILTLILAFFFSIGTYLFAEKNKIKMLQIGTIIFSVLFYFNFEENLFGRFFMEEIETIVYIIVTLIGIISFIYIAPFLKKIFKKEDDINQNTFLNYVSAISSSLSTATIIGFITMFLGFAALGAFFLLFNLDINESKLFSTWSVFSLSLMAPLFFLINLPKNINSEKIDKNNKLHFFITNYLALPAISIYFIILYSYTVKVLINFSNWPQGKISWLIIGFSLFGYFIYITIYKFKTKIKGVSIFIKYFPVVVLQQIIMLFYAIFLRINQHGWTINRYLVVTFGIWLTFISLYYLKSKNKYLKFIPASLTFIVLMISLSGPFSVYSFPELNQREKLKDNLITAKILQNNKIIPLNRFNQIDAKLSGKIYGSIDYLCRFHGCQSLDFIFEKEIKEIKKEHKEKFEQRKLKMKDRMIHDYEYREISLWEMINNLTNLLKVKAYYANSERYVPEFISLTTEKRDSEIDIKNYDIFMQLGRFNESNELSEVIKKYSLQKKISEINRKLTKLYEDKKTFSNNDWNNSRLKLPADDLTFEFETEKYKVLMRFNYFEIKNPQWQPEEKEIERVEKENLINVENIINLPAHFGNFMEGYILLKEKE